MMQQRIYFIEHKTSIDRRVYKEAYQFREDCRAPWLQKACFYILRKLEAFYVGEDVRVERHLIDGKSFIERLFKQQQSVLEQFNIKPTRLLIGAEDYAEMMHELSANQRFEFKTEYVYERTICGLRVEVIPWMRGVLVMPPDK